MNQSNNKSAQKPSVCYPELNDQELEVICGGGYIFPESERYEISCTGNSCKLVSPDDKRPSWLQK